MVLSIVPTVGKYRLGERIERPGPGESFVAHHRQRFVVVRLLPDLPPEQLAEFEERAARLANLDHSRIAPLLAYGLQGDIAYLVTPLVGGERLATSLLRKQPRPGDLAALIRQLAEAIDHAHGGDVVHGAFSATSVLVDGDGEPVIDDFGVDALYAETPTSPGADIAALARLAETGLANPAPEIGAEEAATQAVLRQGLAGDGYRSAGEFAAALSVAVASTESAAVAARAQQDGAASVPRTGQPFLPKAPRARRITAIWGGAIAAMFLLLLMGYVAMSRSGVSQETVVPPVVQVQAELPPTGDLPYYFPFDNGQIAAKYAESQSLLPPEAADARLHRFAAECANPLVEETCLLVYVFYGKQADSMFNYHYSVNEDRLIGNFVEPAENDDFRVAMDEPPWERNPDWAKLIKESHAQLPKNLRFAARLSSRAAALNGGGGDWTMVYVDRADEKTQLIFQLTGDQVSKSP